MRIMTLLMAAAITTIAATFCSRGDGTIPESKIVELERTGGENSDSIIILPPPEWGTLDGEKDVKAWFPLRWDYKGSVNQGMAVYGDTAVVLCKKGWVRILNLKKRKIVKETTLASFSETNHANTAQFGRKENPSDKLPLLYVSECTPPCRCFVERYTGDGFELVQEISSDMSVIDWIADAAEGFLYSYEQGESRDSMVIRRFRLPDPSGGNVGLMKKDALATWRFGVSYPHTIQGGTILNGTLIMTYGTTTQPRGLHFIDLGRGSLTDLDLSEDLDTEPEDIDIWRDKIIMYAYAGSLYTIMNLKGI